MKKYVSDIFGVDEIRKLNLGDTVAIWSPTGSGKSHLIKNVVNSYCREKGWKCLLISNRKILRTQNDRELRYIDGSSVDTINYQGLELEYEGDFESLFDGYEIIVFDEVHYLLSDSEFNRNTDILLKMMKNTPSSKICIFMTATPEALECCDIKFTKLFEVSRDYSYIKDVYFYNSESTLDEILDEIPSNEKAIYFCSSAIDAYEKSIMFQDTSFICSENNMVFYKRSSMSERSNIINNEKFSCKILCCTKVLDNGVNIKDRSVKHIIIDMLDPIVFIQCLGRKRIIDENDSVTLYIKNYPNNQISFIRKRYLEELSVADELFKIGKEEFIKKYKKSNLDEIIDNDITVNMAKYYQCKFLSTEYQKMTQHGYESYMCEKLGIPIEESKSAEIFFEKRSLSTILESYIGVKMFKEEQEAFKNEFFDNIFETKSKNYKRRGLKSINAILEEDSLNYTLVSTKDRSRGANRDKIFWQLLKY